MYTFFQTHSTTIRGITYVTASYYSKEKPVFDRIGNLILNDYQAYKDTEITDESLVDSDMDKEDD